MRIYKPRKRIALNVETIEDAEVREILKELSALQKETNGLTSGFSSQVQIAEQEAQAMISKMKQTSQQFEEVLTGIKSQVQQLTNSALKYIQMNNANLGDQKPKFRDSFIYLTKDAVSNLKQLVEGLQNQVGDILGVQGDGTQVEIGLENDGLDTDMTPDNLLTSSINSKNMFKAAFAEAYDEVIKIAAVLPSVMQTVEKLTPIINQAKTVNQNNEKIVTQLQEVMGAVPEAKETELEETEAFSTDIPAEEVDEATNLEEDMNLEEEATNEDMTAPAEEAPEEDAMADVEVDADVVPEEDNESKDNEDVEEDNDEDIGEPAPEEEENDEGGEPAPEEPADVDEEEAIIEDVEEEAPKEAPAEEE